MRGKQNKRKVEQKKSERERGTATLPNRKLATQTTARTAHRPLVLCKRISIYRVNECANGSEIPGRLRLRSLSVSDVHDKRSLTTISSRVLMTRNVLGRRLTQYFRLSLFFTLTCGFELQLDGSGSG